MKKIYLTLLILLSGCAGVYFGDELPDLKGESDAKVLEILGKPVATRQEGDFKMWAYHQADCSTLVFFGTDNTVQYAERRGQCTPENSAE